MGFKEKIRIVLLLATFFGCIGLGQSNTIFSPKPVFTTAIEGIVIGVLLGLYIVAVESKK
jgi:hypothetical protein